MPVDMDVLFKIEGMKQYKQWVIQNRRADFSMAWKINLWNKKITMSILYEKKMPIFTQKRAHPCFLPPINSLFFASFGSFMNYNNTG